MVLNFTDKEEDDKRIQLSVKTYASDTCTPLHIQKGKYSQMSKLRIVPELKYESHLELIEELSKPGPRTDMDNYYDHFFQEGESNIQKQMDNKDKHACFGDVIQLYHEATGRYLMAIPVDRSDKEDIESKKHMSYKLGFSMHPNKQTHFTFESLYNSNTIYESKWLADFDQVYLSFKDNDYEYHLVLENNELLFKAGEKQNLILRRFRPQEGNPLNDIQEKVKYVYIRHGQDNDFLVPRFDNKFNVHKLKYIKVDKLSETTSLKYDLVWKCIVHDEETVTFVHCKSGVVLSFDDDRPIPIPSTHNRDYEELITNIEEGSYAFKLLPMKYKEPMFETLLKRNDFKLVKEIGGKPSVVRYYKDKTVDSTDPMKRKGEARFNTAPNLKDQDYIDEETYDLGSAEVIKFRQDTKGTTEKGAIFSIVILEDIWKQEISFAQSLSAIIKAHYWS